jgi:PAS domain S-box-containing protein
VVFLAAAAIRGDQVPVRDEYVEALRATKEELEIVCETMAVGVARYSRDLRCRWANRTYAALRASTPEELVGRTMAQVLGEQGLAAISPQLERLLAGEPVRYERLVEFPGSGARWTGVVATPIFDGNGRPDGFVSVLSDIHERKLAEEALKVEERRKDEFLATLAHELRNPLEPIRNAIEIMKRQGPLEAGVAWSRDVVERQLGVMVRLIDDLLDVARISRGSLALRKRPIALEQAIDIALETSGPLVRAGGHFLSVQSSSEPIMVEADGVRLGQVFSNLLSNAAKYMEPGGEICLSVEADGGYAIVSVEDSGMGFAPEAAAALFEPFSQLPAAPARRRGGLGIGLALARAIVEMHGGSIQARSAGAGRGSEFIVRLPLASAAGAREPQPAYAPARAQGRKLRIAVADDNRDSADSLQRMLQLDGHDVEVAYDGVSALQLLRRPGFEVAVIDIGMPGLDGYELARAVREQGSDVTLVALTGYGQARDRREAMDAGFDFHLTKPVAPALLAALLARGFSRSR